jgi:hypothetical protein
MLGIRRAGIVLLVVALTLALGVAVAGAKKKHKKKKSKLDACRDSRVATLYYTDPNTGETRPLAVQRTDSKGNYQMALTTPAYAGSYQVIVVEQKIRAMKAPQICNAATSAAVVV